MDDDGKVRLTLFVMGTGPRSVRAIVNLRALCERALAGAYRLEVVDIAVEPGQARAHQLLAVPTLLINNANPPHRFVGDLSDGERVLAALSGARNAIDGRAQNLHDG